MTTIMIQLILKMNLVDVARQQNNVGILRGGVVSVMFYLSNHSHESSFLKPRVDNLLCQLIEMGVRDRGQPDI